MSVRNFLMVVAAVLCVCIQPVQAQSQAGTALPTATPAQAGFSAEKLQRIDKVIDGEVKQGFPGAVLVVARNGKIVKASAYGWARMYDGKRLLPVAERQPMTVDTMFDIASNTKIYATIFAFMKLNGEGRVNPDDLVCTYLPEFTGQGREKIRISDVMSHSAGFAPDVGFHRPEAGSFYSLDRKRTERLLNKVPVTYERGTKQVYSDTDYMLLGTIVEKITGQRLDAYVEKEIYRPLGLTHTLFLPLQKGFAPTACAATEICGNTRCGMVSFPGVRTHTLQGEVQDEQSWYSMGGVAGHAGLFSRAGDLAVLAQVVLNGGSYGTYKLCRPWIVSDYMRPRNAKYALGWNIAAPGREWEFGSHASPSVVGHSGWTGTDIVIDPAYGLVIVLLTNRVHAPNVPGKPNTFVFDEYKTDSYGDIISMVYEAMVKP